MTSTDGYFARPSVWGTNVPRDIFYAFDIMDIPPDATLISVQLVTTQIRVTGTPYAELGGVVLADHIEANGVFDQTTFDAEPLDEAFGTLSEDATLGQRTLDVTDQVAADRAAGRTSSEFRFRFPIGTNGDGAEDRAAFADMSGTSARVPMLVVTHAP